jgi:phage host-nuclease inhibitor protein Gam
MTRAGVNGMTAEEFESEAEPDTYLDAEGWEVDGRTGEVTRHVAFTPEFSVNSDEAAEAVLAAHMRAEGIIVGLTAELAALTVNVETRINAQRRRIAYLDWRFRADLINHARGRLVGKARTATYTHGRVAFRTSPPSTTIIDMAAAVAFVETFGQPDQVERPEPRVSLKAVKLAMPEAQRQTGEDDRPAFLATSEPEETITIKTGVEPPKGRKP